MTARATFRPLPTVHLRTDGPPCAVDHSPPLTDRTLHLALGDSARPQRSKWPWTAGRTSRSTGREEAYAFGRHSSAHSRWADRRIYDTEIASTVSSRLPIG